MIIAPLSFYQRLSQVAAFPKTWPKAHPLPAEAFFFFFFFIFFHRPEVDGIRPKCCNITDLSLHPKFSIMIAKVVKISYFRMK